MINAVATLIPAVILVFLFIAIEYLDWRGRMELIEQRYPKVWKLINNRLARLSLIVLLIALIWQDLEKSTAIAPAPVIVYMPSPSLAFPKTIPKLKILWNGEPLDGKTIQLDSFGGNFGPLPFQFESNVPVPHWAVNMYLSWDMSPGAISENKWSQISSAEPNFPFAWSWISEQAVDANQPWPGPNFYGSLWDIDKQIMRPLKVLIKVYFNSGSAPQTATFSIVAKKP